jgi:hypothetical protein
MPHVLVWDVEIVPDLAGFAAANAHDGKTEDEILCWSRRLIATVQFGNCGLLQDVNTYRVWLRQELYQGKLTELLPRARRFWTNSLTRGAVRQKPLGDGCT